MTSEERRAKSNQQIKSEGITCLESLPLVEDDLKLRSKEEVCRRVLANICAIQVACDVGNGKNVKESAKFFKKYLKKFKVAKNLLPIEKKLFKNKQTENEAVAVAWNYETTWVLLWALSKVDKLDFPSDICDVQKVLDVILNNDSFDEFYKSCTLRGREELLDALDLYYRYHWACVDATINQNTSIGNLNGEVVVERRRALEWLFSDEDDWFEISLDT